MSIRRERNNTPTRDPIDMAPELGYRISSNRQPGIEQANTRTGPYRPLPITPNYERPMPYPLPIPPDYGPRPMPMPFQRPKPKQFDDYFNRGMRRGIDSLTPSNIGFDRMGGPDRALPGDILHMLENPENYRGMEDLRELEEQMDPDNYFTNRIAVGEQFGVDPFGDPGSTEAPYREGAAVDPSDWRNILRILEAGGDPQTETAGIMGAMPQERQMAELNERQKRALGTRVNRFAYDEGISSPQDMLKMISPLDKPSFFGFGGNEANEQDIIDFYKNNTSMVG